MLTWLANRPGGPLRSPMTATMNFLSSPPQVANLLEHGRCIMRGRPNVSRNTCQLTALRWHVSVSKHPAVLMLVLTFLT